jgi:hypothetical protein
MPWEDSAPSLAWAQLEMLLPLAQTLSSLRINANVDPNVDVNDESDPSLVLVLNQDRINFVASHLTNLSELIVYSPIVNNVSFAALSHLTSLRLEPDMLPKPLKFQDQILILPSNLLSLHVSYYHATNGSSWMKMLQPLVKLTELNWSAPAFDIDEFDKFVQSLPKQLTRLEMMDCLRKARIKDGVAPRQVEIRLPNLIELEINDDLLSQKKVTFAFAQAPRLRLLRYTAQQDQCYELLSSLANFPSARSCSLNPEKR